MKIKTTGDLKNFLYNLITTYIQLCNHRVKLSLVFVLLSLVTGRHSFTIEEVSGNCASQVFSIVLMTTVWACSVWCCGLLLSLLLLLLIDEIKWPKMKHGRYLIRELTIYDFEPLLIRCLVMYL